jgi:hypothetical protein
MVSPELACHLTGARYLLLQELPLSAAVTAPILSDADNNSEWDLLLPLGSALTNNFVARLTDSRISL